jgi:hypothetical protein
LPFPGLAAIPGLEGIQSIGFWIVHLAGWLLYLPIVAFTLAFYFIVVVLLAQTLDIVIGWIGVRATQIALKVVYFLASLVAFALQMLGGRVGFDPASIRSVMHVPAGLIRSVFNLMRPNRVTFCIGCIGIPVILHDLFLVR